MSSSELIETPSVAMQVIVHEGTTCIGESRWEDEICLSEIIPIAVPYKHA